MTTMAAIVPEIRRILGDLPEQVHLNGAIANGTEETVVVDSVDVGKVAPGQILEHDVGGEQRYVVSVDGDTSSFEAYRGYNGTTAASSHADNSFMFINPRFPYASIEQAVNQAIAVELFEEKLYDLNEHTVTSNSDGTRDYNAPSSSCEKFLSVYQFTSGMTEPYFLYPEREFSVYPRNVDTTHHATGKMFTIRRNLGTPGTDSYYVTCAHRLAISTLNDRHEEIVKYLAAAALLEWEDVRRVGMSNDQGDRTVRPRERLQQAAYFRQMAEKWANDARAADKKLLPPTRIFRAGTGRRLP